ncbi:hypothetical protein [Steroidobacter sp.]|uniref:hypothetical protein n=1 Tax=Steroidobacter sp. TaxID=1978227 RepID=UPI001A414300|nr:hypothetical protein [Steroidobacter sp.]MBL8265494.1 hypothetical protein [Steroidobacter sp.]
MQLSVVDSGRQVTPRSAVEGVALKRTEFPAPVGKIEAVAPVSSRGGLKTYDGELNRQVSGAQQALQFLAEADARLRSLRKELTSGDAAAAIEKFSQFWQQRSAASAGTLDGNLKFNADTQGKQEFAVRGLSFETLRSGDTETLSFAVGRWSRQSTSITVDPNQSESAIVGALDRALAPMGVRATRDAKGELAFNVAEADWPQVRDSLAIRGGGRRFPTGQFNQVRTVVAEQAIQPSQWSSTDPRSALKDITQAQLLIRKSYGDARAVLDEAAQNVDGRSTTTVQGAYWQDFAEEYADTLGRGDAAAIAATAPAVAGISKRTVSALLAAAPATP